MRWYYAGHTTGERNLKRREFLRTGVGAALLAKREAFGQLALPQTAAKKAEGILVNDVPSEPSSARVVKIVEPRSAGGVRAAHQAAQNRGKSICIAGGRHSMGG